jgi:hypothetical protein
MAEAAEDGSTRVGDISNSPAYLILDDLYNNSKITHPAATLYRNKYRELYEAVIQTFRDEKMYLDRAKTAKLQVDAEKLKYEQKTALLRDTELDLVQLDKAERESRDEITALRQEEEANGWALKSLRDLANEKKSKLEVQHCL